MSSSAVTTQEKTAQVGDATGSALPTVENFYKYCAEGTLMGVKCKRCGTIICPPRMICPKCFADEFEWTELEGRGRLLTYTIIHFAATQLQALAPYAVGIVKLEQGPQLPGMKNNIKLEELHIGARLQVDFETTIPKEWPRWPRYFFKPAS